jgi:hypothetical protein
MKGDELIIDNGHGVVVTLHRLLLLLLLLLPLLLW